MHPDMRRMSWSSLMSSCVLDKKNAQALRGTLSFCLCSDFRIIWENGFATRFGTCLQTAFQFGFFTTPGRCIALLEGQTWKGYAEEGPQRCEQHFPDFVRCKLWDGQIWRPWWGLSVCKQDLDFLVRPQTVSEYCCSIYDRRSRLCNSGTWLLSTCVWSCGMTCWKAGMSFSVWTLKLRGSAWWRVILVLPWLQKLWMHFVFSLRKASSCAGFLKFCHFRFSFKRHRSPFSQIRLQIEWCSCEMWRMLFANWLGISDIQTAEWGVPGAWAQARRKAASSPTLAFVSGKVCAFYTSDLILRYMSRLACMDMMFCK